MNIKKFVQNIQKISLNLDLLFRSSILWIIYHTVTFFIDEDYVQLK